MQDRIRHQNFDNQFAPARLSPKATFLRESRTPCLSRRDSTARIASAGNAYFDTNQSIYGDLAKELASFRIVPIHLTRNLRNTRCIHQAASRFYKGIPITADGPEGVKVEWVECSADQIASRATAATLRLTREKVSVDDIVILVAEDRMLSNIRNRSGFPEGVSVSLIRDYKGLERKAVIPAATRELADEAELAYVSLSRPRAQLVVVGDSNMLAWLGAQLR
jgi:hypothetical protein